MSSTKFKLGGGPFGIDYRIDGLSTQNKVVYSDYYKNSDPNDPEKGLTANTPPNDILINYSLPWIETSGNQGYKIKGVPIKQIVPGTLPTFSNLLNYTQSTNSDFFSIEYLPSEETLVINNTTSTYSIEELLRLKSSISIKKYTAKDFQDKVLPRRLIVLIQAPGGGGAGGGAWNNAGQGGFSGAFAGVVLNLDPLYTKAKADLNNRYIYCFQTIDSNGARIEKFTSCVGIGGSASDGWAGADIEVALLKLTPNGASNHFTTFTENKVARAVLVPGGDGGAYDGNRDWITDSSGEGYYWATVNSSYAWALPVKRDSSLTASNTKVFEAFKSRGGGYDLNKKDVAGNNTLWKYTTGESSNSYQLICFTDTDTNISKLPAETLNAPESEKDVMSTYKPCISVGGYCGGDRGQAISEKNAGGGGGASYVAAGYKGGPGDGWDSDRYGYGSDNWEGRDSSLRIGVGGGGGGEGGLSASGGGDGGGFAIWIYGTPAA